MKARVEFLDHLPEDGKCPICDGSGRCRPCSGSGDFETFHAVLREDLARAPVRVVTEEALREAAESEDDADEEELVVREITLAEASPWYMTALEWVAVLSVTVTALWATFRAGRAGAHAMEIVAWCFYVALTGVAIGVATGSVKPENRQLVTILGGVFVTVVGVAIVRGIYP